MKLVTQMIALLLNLVIILPSADSIIDSVRFLRPEDFDVLLTDMAESDLRLMAQMDGVGYLNVSSETTPLFPVQGSVMGAHRRLMVNLLVRKHRTQRYMNVIFMIDTGSPYTFLSASAMAALSGARANVPKMTRLEIHGVHPMVCYMSPPDKHFSDINLLGMDFLELKQAQLDIDWTQKAFWLST